MFGEGDKRGKKKESTYTRRKGRRDKRRGGGKNITFLALFLQRGGEGKKAWKEGKKKGARRATLSFYREKRGESEKGGRKKKIDGAKSYFFLFPCRLRREGAQKKEKSRCSLSTRIPRRERRKKEKKRDFHGCAFSPP